MSESTLGLRDSLARLVISSETFNLMGVDNAKQIAVLTKVVENTNTQVNITNKSTKESMDKVSVAIIEMTSTIAVIVSDTKHLENRMVQQFESVKERQDANVKASTESHERTRAGLNRSMDTMKAAVVHIEEQHRALENRLNEHTELNAEKRGEAVYRAGFWKVVNDSWFKIILVGVMAIPAINVIYDLVTAAKVK